jgi:transposase
MNLAPLFLLPTGARLRQVTLLANAVVLEATTASRGARPCPHCQTPSAHVHSSYTRTIADVPSGARRVIVRLHVRKFRCRNAQCPQRIFAERFPAYAHPRARKTIRMQDQLRSLGLLAGGRGGEALAQVLGIQVSDCTILRLLCARPEPPVPPVRVLGVDDFAFRRGRTYGTLLVDLEQHRVIDLLADRAQIDFALWLQGHPEVEVVSRDRGGDYAAAATFAAPTAVQVADRFHLLANAGEALERCLTRYHVQLREAARLLADDEAPVRTTKRTPTEQQRQRERRGSRLERYEQVVALAEQGISARQIAFQLRMARGTILKYLRAKSFPEHASRPRPRLIDPYVPYLQERWTAGEHSARVLWREICARGFPASDVHVRRLVDGWPRSHKPSLMRGTAGSPLAAKPEVVYYSVHKTRWLLMKPVGDLSAAESAYITTLMRLCPPIADTQSLLRSFHWLLTERASDQLPAWLEQCEDCRIAELVGFAQGLRRDYAAVEGAVRSPWSQGQTEGQVNRLKMLKRQMYGRAGFALLRRRVLQQQTCAP